jgi:hypothetical protein
LDGDWPIVILQSQKPIAANQSSKQSLPAIHRYSPMFNQNTFGGLPFQSIVYKRFNNGSIFSAIESRTWRNAPRISFSLLVAFAGSGKL